MKKKQQKSVSKKDLLAQAYRKVAKEDLKLDRAWLGTLSDGGMK